MQLDERLAMQSCCQEEGGKEPLEPWAAWAGAAGRGGCGSVRFASGEVSCAAGGEALLEALPGAATW